MILFLFCSDSLTVSGGRCWVGSALYIAPYTGGSHQQFIIFDDGTIHTLCNEETFEAISDLKVDSPPLHLSHICFACEDKFSLIAIYVWFKNVYFQGNEINKYINCFFKLIFSTCLIKVKEENVSKGNYYCDRYSLRKYHKFVGPKNSWENVYTNIS